MSGLYIKYMPTPIVLSVAQTSNKHTSVSVKSEPKWLPSDVIQVEFLNLQLNLAKPDISHILCQARFIYEIRKSGWDLLQTHLHVTVFCRTAWYYSCLAADSADARCRSAMSMATTFCDAAYSWRILIAALTTATGKQSTQIPVNIPNDSGPSGTTTQPLITAILSQSNKSFYMYSVSNKLESNNMFFM